MVCENLLVWYKKKNNGWWIVKIFVFLNVDKYFFYRCLINSWIDSDGEWELF